MQQRSALTRALILATLLAVPVAASAQSTSSSLEGTVKTPKGLAVPGAVVEARSQANGAVRIVTTDENGRYTIDLLQPGSWWVVAQLASGETSKPSVLTLGLQQTLVQDLVVGTGITETVTVTAEAPLVDAQRSGGELRLSGRQATELPVASSSVTDLALLDSSIRTAAAGDFYGERGAVFVVNGQSGRANSFLVDGLDNNDQVSGTTLNSYFSQEVIKEFVILTHQFAPEFGRASGGVLNIITEQGTNEPTGEVFLQGASNAWNRPGDFVSSLPERGQKQDSSDRFVTGFKLGGPFVRDKAFYFGAFEHRRANEVSPFTGTTRDGTSGGWVTAPAGSDNLFVRTDYNLGTRHFLMLRLSGDRRSTDALNVGGNLTPEAGFRLEEEDWQLASSLTTVVSPAVLNEIRFLAGTSVFDQSARSGRAGVEHPSGIFGGNVLARQRRDETRFQVVDNLTFRAKNHTVKLGLDVTRSRTRVATAFNPNGNFLYNTDRPYQPGDCGGIIVSQIDPDDPWAPIPCSDPGADGNGNGIRNEAALIGTYPVVYTLIDGRPEATLDDTRFSLFVQDAWQAIPSLRFDYGLRYDLSTFTLPESSRIEKTPIPNGGAGIDTGALAPRLGFAWTPYSDGRLVVRGGAGIFYDKLVLAFPAISAIASEMSVRVFFPQALTAEEINDTTMAARGAEVLASRGYSSAFIRALDPAAQEQAWIALLRRAGALVFPGRYTMYFSTGTELDTPYSTQYNLGVEVATGRRSVFHADAVRSLGYHLPLMRDLNPVVNVSDAGTPQAKPRHLDESLGIRFDRLVGSIAALVTEGRSWYTGLTLGWRWQGDSAGIAASYTWSKSDDQGPDPLKGGLGLPPQSVDLDLESARADTDRRHRVSLYGEAILPWFGIRASAVVQYASAAPFNVTTGRDENLDGITSDRPRGLGRNSGEDTPLWVVNSLRAEENVRNGAALPPISSLEEPDFFQVDVRLQKNLGGRPRGWSGSVYVQVYNLFDRVNASAIQGRVVARDFGRPLALAGPPRTFEVGLRAGF